MSSILFRCAACSGTNIVGPYAYTTFEDFFAIPGAKTGFFNATLTAQAAHARVCTDCGHLMYFVDDKTLAAVRKVAEGPHRGL